MFFSRKKPLATLNTVEILSKNIHHNLRVLQKSAGKKIIFPVLKSNAYGHGIKEIAEILKNYNTPYFAVDSYFEALEIWKVKKRPVLVMGPNIPQNLSSFSWKYLTICVSNLEILEALCALKKKIKIHLFINTGMNREGFLPADLPKIIEILKKNKKINVEGFMSHLASADEDSSSPLRRGARGVQRKKEHLTIQQSKVFSKCLDDIFEAAFSPQYIHLQNSAGLPQNIFDERINACRPGVSLYGINPLPSSHPDYKKLEKLKPAMRIFSTVTNIQNIKKGEKISYNGTFTAKKEMRVGIIPLGYQEFLDRRLSNSAIFLHKKTPVSLLGRVCMNLSCFDASSKKIKIGDKIKVFSEKKIDENSAENIAKKIGTIPYEVLTGVDASIRRVVT